MAGDEPDNKKTKAAVPDINTMTSKQYLDSMVVPHLLPALNAVSTNRPQDPIQFLVRINKEFIVFPNFLFPGRLFTEEQEGWL